MAQNEDPEMKSTDDRITIHLSKKDVNAAAIFLSSGVIGMEAAQNIMRVAVGTPKEVNDYIGTVVKDAGMVYERLMKLAKDRWPDGLIEKKQPLPPEANPVLPEEKLKVEKN